MMKKLLAMLMVVSMIVSLGIIPAMAAEPTTISELVSASGVDIEATLGRTVGVPADVNVKVSSDSKYVDGPISVRTKNVNKIDTFDYQAVITMSGVADVFDDYTGTLEALINGGSYSSLTKTALLADLESLPVSGTFVIKAYLPESNFEIPEAVISGSDMEGFNDAAKALFSEAAPRTYEDDVLTITIKVGGGTATANDDYATKAEIAANIGEDLVFICEDVLPKAYDTYQVMGSVEGSTTIGNIGTIPYEMEAVDETAELEDGTVVPAATVKVIKTSTGSPNISTPPVVDPPVVTPPVVDPTPIKPADPESTGISKVLNTVDHIKYLNGYETGIFGPNDNMTRAEVAQMFYNLLLNQAVAGNASFVDVADNAWYHDAVVALANMGIVEGRGNGIFDPAAPITRAEFTVIAMRFVDINVTGTVTYNDVPATHWAAKSISEASTLGWMSGVSTGIFSPDATITRASVAKVVNNMLGRSADMEYVNANVDSLIMFPDVAAGAWYYADVVESTNTHNAAKEDGVETWVAPEADVENVEAGAEADVEAGADADAETAAEAE